MATANGNGDAVEFITVGTGGDARRIAVSLQRPAAGNGLAHFVWLGGYRSDMSGTKAMELAGLAARLGTGCVRFDYSGHGASGGAFTDGTISRWLEEALAVVDHAVKTIGTRRAVGLKPVRPHSAEGMRTEPPVSVPIAAAAMPSVTEIAAPEEDPPGMRPVARSQGLRGVP